MQIFREIDQLKAFLVEKRESGKTVGFVPTMGALHQGHISLIHHSQNENSATICSIFVNPSQFNNSADLQKYPRTPESDIKLLEKAGCNALFIPEVAEMYEREGALRFDFGHLDKIMEGQFRPGHFSGVALVVSKLFHIVQPDTAYFGQKDWQQFVIVRQLVKELKFNLQVKSIPTFREHDGLAMSSRNARLTTGQRKKAAVLFRALQEASIKLKKGVAPEEVKNSVKTTLEHDAEIKLEYIELADRENLNPLANVEESSNAVLCIAAFVGEVRLIDNVFL